MTAAQKKKEKVYLDVEKREVFGKKLTPLREEGMIPANIFGKDFESTAISVDGKVFLKTFRQAGETQVIYLKLGKKEIPALVANVQLDPISDDVIHADFRTLDLTQKTEADVPVLVVGEAPAVEQKLGDLINPVDSLTVEALPNMIPSEIEIDVSKLEEVDQGIQVSDLPKSSDYTILNDPETVIVKIAEHQEEELEAQIPDEDELVEGEVAEGEEGAEGAEGEAADGEETPAEGGEEKPAEEGGDKKE